MIRPSERENSKLLEITPAGRERLQLCAREKPPWEREHDANLQAVADLRSVIGQIHLAAMHVAQAGNEQQIERASQTLAETGRALYRIAGKRGSRSASVY